MPEPRPSLSGHPMYYDRDGAPCDFETWVALMEREDRQVGLDQVDEDTVVSTVYLGIDLMPVRWVYGLDDDGLPTIPAMVYETAILSRDGDVYIHHRAPTEEIARRAHAEAIEQARAGHHKSQRDGNQDEQAP